MFAKIAELQPCYTPISLLGIVVSCKPARKSRGEDMVMNMILRDCSCKSENQFISVNLFQQSPDDLPDGAKSGNIVMLQSLKIKPFENSVQGISTFGFKFAVFQWDPRQSDLAMVKATANFSPSADLLDAARRIYSHFNSTFSLKKAQTESTGKGFIEEENSDSEFAKPKKEQTSKTPKASVDLPQLLTAEQLQLKETKFSFIGQVLRVMASHQEEQKVQVSLSDFTSSEFISTAKEIPGFPTNTVLNVIFRGIDAKMIVDAVEIGDFILCSSILAKPKKDLLKFDLQSGSNGAVGFTKIQPQSPLLQPLIALKRKLKADDSESEEDSESDSESEFYSEKIESSKAKRGKQSQELFDTISPAPDRETQQFIDQLLKSKAPTKIPPQHLFTFQEIQKYPSRGEPIKFICKFRIQSTIPRNICHLTLPLCLECRNFVLEVCPRPLPPGTCPNCRQSPPVPSPSEDRISFAYRFVIEAIEDDCERTFPVLIEGEEAEKLLGGIVAADLPEDAYSLQLVKRSLEAIVSGKLLVNAVIVRSIDPEHKGVRYRVSRFLFFSPSAVE